MTFPWEQKLPELTAQAEPPAKPVEDVVKALQADLRYMVTHTAVLVRATGPHEAALGMLVNTARGQLIPAGVAKYSGGHTIQFQDLGMPQIGAPEMTIDKLVQCLFGVTQQLGLELEP